MTRKDFKAIAEVLHTSKPIHYTAEGVWEETCENMADAIASMNPKFDAKRFLTACGVNANDAQSKAVWDDYGKPLRA